MTDLAWLNGPASQVAPRLLGCEIERELNGTTLRARIVETEAYDQTDAASHSYRGRTPRTDVMFGPAGRLYVYFTYGMHYCMNIVCGLETEGAAVLIRAVEPLSAVKMMSRNRGGIDGITMTNGPAKTCQALAIDRQWNGHDMTKPPLQLIICPALPKDSIVQTTRIGISKATHLPWRFYERGNKYVSRV